MQIHEGSANETLIKAPQETIQTPYLISLIKWLFSKSYSAQQGWEANSQLRSSAFIPWRKVIFGLFFWQGRARGWGWLGHQSQILTQCSARFQQGLMALGVGLVINSPMALSPTFLKNHSRLFLLYKHFHREVPVLWCLTQHQAQCTGWVCDRQSSPTKRQASSETPIPALWTDRILPSRFQQSEQNLHFGLSERVKPLGCPAVLMRVWNARH